MNGVRVEDPWMMRPEHGHLGSHTADEWLAAASAEAGMDDVEVERARLERELAEAKDRIEAAHRRATDLRAALQAEVLASQAHLAELDRQHLVAMAMVRDTANAEAARIVAEARCHAADGGPAGQPHDEATAHGI